MLETTFVPIDNRRLAAIGTGVLRYGTAGLLLMWGAFKFTADEAQAIRPLVEHHPLMAWMESALGVAGTSAAIGIIEIAAGLLMVLRRASARWSAIGSALATLTFATTVSFLFTTPGALSPSSPFNGFLMKDVVLLGAALFTAAEARAASAGTATERS